MKILIIADIPEHIPGGMRLFIGQTANELRRTGHVVDLVFSEQIAAGAHGRIRRLVAPLAAAARAVARHRTARYDIVVIHEPLAMPYAVLARLAGKRRLAPLAVLTFGSELRGWQARKDRASAVGSSLPLKTRILVPLMLLSQVRLALKQAAQILVPSSGDITFLERELGLGSDRIFLVPTGVSPSFFSVARGDSDGSLRALFVGSWIDRKGNRELVGAWNTFARSHPEARLTVLGSGADADDVVSWFDPAVRGSVHVVAGFPHEELGAVLAQHNVFVLPSWMEGMPLATLEAAASGLACVVSRIPGHTDIFRPDMPEDDGAIFVPPHDSRSIVAALERLAESDSLIEELGLRARARARQFSWKRTAEGALEAFRRARLRS